MNVSGYFNFDDEVRWALGRCAPIARARGGNEMQKTNWWVTLPYVFKDGGVTGIPIPKFASGPVVNGCSNLTR
jgi:hypothetical protein